jgi:hypothetical protein
MGTEYCLGKYGTADTPQGDPDDLLRIRLNIVRIAKQHGAKE